MAGYDIGPQISIKGESEFNDQIKRINNSVKEYTSEMKALTEQFDTNADSMEALTAKNKNLSSQYDLQKQKLQVLQKQREKEVKELNDLADALEKAKKENEANSDAVTKAQRAYNQQEAVVSKLNTAINETQAILNKTGNSIKQNDVAMAEMNSSLEELRKEAKKAQDEFETLRSSLGDKLASGLKTLATSAAAGVTGLVALVQTTGELRGDMSVLARNAEEAGVSFETANNALLDFNAVSGETDSSIEAISNLLQAGFNENNLARAVDTLSGAVIRFPDTLKIESLADSLQETLATSAATGQFAELLERLGYNLDEFDAGLQACTTATDKQEYALRYLARSGLADTNEAYEEQNKDLIENSKQQLKLQQNLAEIGGNFAPLVNRAMSALNDVLSDLSETGVPMLVDGLNWLMDNGEIVISVLGGITAAVIAYKTAAVITEAIKTFQAMKTAIEAARTAQLALNVAQLATPVGLIAAAVGGLTAGVALLATTMSDSNEETDVYKQRMEELDAQMSELEKSMDEASKTRESTIANIEAESAANEALASELQSLMDVENKSSEQKERIKNIVDQLNYALPDLNLAYEEEADKLNMSAEAIDNYIESAEQRLRLQAAEEDMKTIIQQQYEAQKQLTAAAEEQEAAVGRVIDAFVKYNAAIADPQLGANNTDYFEALQEAQEDLDYWNDEVDRAKENQEELNGQMQTTKDTMAEFAGEIEDTSDTTEEFGEVTEDTSDTLKKEFKILRDEYAGLLESAENSINNQIGLFDEINTESDLTFAQMKQRLADQAKALNDWADNLQTAAKKGIDQGLLKELADAGPESAGYLAIIANLTDEEIDDLNAAWRDRFNASEYAAQEMANTQFAIENQAVGIAAAALSAAQTAFQNFTNGINQKQPAAEAASRNLLNGAVGALSGGYNSFYSLGQDAGQGYANGVASKAAAAAAQAAALVGSAMAAAARAQNSNSPSKEFAKLGGDGGEGYILGFEEKMNDVRPRITRSIQQNLDAASKAQINSGRARTGTGNSLTAKDVAKGIQQAGLKFYVGEREFARLQRRASRA